MVGEDREYVIGLIKAGKIQSPCLELGTGYGGATNREFILDAGIEYIATDLEPSPSVDIPCDFEDSQENIQQQFKEVAPFGSILVLNVLEHTFDPIRVLDNLFSLLKPGGNCIIITPTVWPLHDFPYDCWRINPNFYEQYAKRRGHELEPEYFRYVGNQRVDRLKQEGAYVLPKPGNTGLKRFYSKTIHRLFNTYGRGMQFPTHVAVGAVLTKVSTSSSHVEQKNIETVL